MADTSNINKFLSDVADAIRSTNHTEGAIPAGDFDKEIQNIPSTIIQPTKSATASNEQVVVTPDANYAGIAEVVIEKVSAAVDKNIIPDNIAEGVTILGVEGVAKVLDTTDATATIKDIAYGKTAYVNGSKIVGDLFTHPSGEVLFQSDKISSVTETEDDVTAIGNVVSDRIVRITTPGSVKIAKNQLAEAIQLTPDKLGKGKQVLGVVGTLESAGDFQEKSLQITKDGSYIVKPDEDYDGLSAVTIDVAVASSMEIQHMPFYLLESDDEGNLWCINNYATIEYSPYSLDRYGNLILTQDDTDTARYWINENMELEVEVNG